MTFLRLPKARVRVVVWQDKETEKHSALVLVAGGRSFFVRSRRREVMERGVQDELDYSYGEKWVLIKGIELGTVEVHHSRDIGFLMEDKV